MWSWAPRFREGRYARSGIMNFAGGDQSVHGGSVLQYPLFWAVLACIFSGAPMWSVTLCSLTWVVRALCMKGIDAVLRRKAGDLARSGTVWLLPFRDILSVIE